MASNDDEVRKIGTKTAGAMYAKAAAIDAKLSNERALTDHPEFGSRKHQKKIDEACDIIDQALDGEFDGFYITHRPNKGDLFTTVKPTNPKLSKLSRKKLHDRLYGPLIDAGHEVVITGAKSILVRVRV